MRSYMGAGACFTDAVTCCAKTTSIKTQLNGAQHGCESISQRLQARRSDRHTHVLEVRPLFKFKQYLAVINGNVDVQSMTSVFEVDAYGERAARRGKSTVAPDHGRRSTQSSGDSTSQVGLVYVTFQRHVRHGYERGELLSLWGTLRNRRDSRGTSLTQFFPIPAGSHGAPQR